MRALGYVIVGAWLAGALGLHAQPVIDTKTPKDHPAKSEQTLKEMTLTGVVTKLQNMKKDGTPFMTWFTLTTEDGVATHLPKGKIEEFVGMRVRLVGMGFDTVKRGKPARTIESITSIEKLDTED